MARPSASQGRRNLLTIMAILMADNPGLNYRKSAAKVATSAAGEAERERSSIQPDALRRWLVRHWPARADELLQAEARRRAEAVARKQSPASVWLRPMDFPPERFQRAVDAARPLVEPFEKMAKFGLFKKL